MDEPPFLSRVNITGNARTRDYVITDELRDACAATDQDSAFAGLQRGFERLHRLNPVSYTHLTLPTILLV